MSGPPAAKDESALVTLTEERVRLPPVSDDALVFFDEGGQQVCV